MSKSPQHNQKTEPKQCKSEVEEIYIYQNLKSGSHSIGISNGFHARENPKEQYLKVDTFGDASLCKKRIYACDRNLDNIYIYIYICILYIYVYIYIH